MTRQAETFFDSIFNGAFPSLYFSTKTPESGRHSLPCDITYEDGLTTIKADVLPGCDKPVVKVEDGLLKIEVSRPVPTDKKGTFERPFGKWTRTWELGDAHDPESVKADLKDGVLTVTVKAAKSSKSRVVEVNT